MKDRLKQLRKENGLTQQEFADTIGIKRNTFAQYENGRNEPIDAVVRLICDKFQINEQWLRTGEGDMKAQVDKEHELYRLVDDALKDDSQEMKRRLATAILKLTPEQMEAGLNWIKDTFGLVEDPAAADQADTTATGHSTTTAAPDAPDTNVGEITAAILKNPGDMTRAELHAELDRQLDLKEDGAKKGSSGTA